MRTIEILRNGVIYKLCAIQFLLTDFILVLFRSVIRIDFSFVRYGCACKNEMNGLAEGLEADTRCLGCCARMHTV